MQDRGAGAPTVEYVLDVVAHAIGGNGCIALLVAELMEGEIVGGHGQGALQGTQRSL